MGTSENYFKDAQKSAKSLKKWNDISVSIMTSSLIADSYPDSIFDNIIVLEEVKDDVRDKIFNLNKTPYDKTIYLDGDTLIVSDITPAFDLLDRVDIAAARSPHHPLVSIDGVPDAFPEMNTGVIAFNSNDLVFKFFDEWIAYFEYQMNHGRQDDTISVEEGKSLEEISRFGRMHGQPPFREALYSSDVKYSVLPSEYNFRSDGAYAYTDVKILHMKDREKLMPIINKELKQRIYWRNRLLVKDGKSYNLGVPILDSLIRTLPVRQAVRKLGLRSQAKSTYDFISRIRNS